MNEKLQYASMLEIPVNSCNITYTPEKKRKVKRKKPRADEDVKKELLDKVNGAGDNAERAADNSAMNETVSETAAGAVNAAVAVNDSLSGSLSDRTENAAVYTEERAGKAKRRKIRVKFNAITVQLAIIGVLIAAIFATNAVFKNSAINTFMRSIFSADDKTAQVQTDGRTYGEFKPVISFAGAETPVIEDGVMTVAGKGSVYTPYDGTVSKVTVDGAGKYSLEIAHSDNFKSVISGLDYAYAETGDKVFGNIPVGYAGDEGVKLCFLGADDALITDYTLDGNAVVWKAA